MSILSDTITATARDAKASEATMRQQLLAAAVEISLMEKTISELETGPMLSKPTADDADGIPEKARDAYRAHRQAVDAMIEAHTGKDESAKRAAEATVNDTQRALDEAMK